MTEELYDPKKLALELGFSEAQAERFAWNGTDATNMRRIAEHLGIGKYKQTIDVPPPEPKKHSHSYRKDGTCACGAVRKAKRSKQSKA